MATNTFSNIAKPTFGNPASAPPVMGRTPFASALNNVASGTRSPQVSPSTSLKSTITTNVDGSSTKHEFHAPADFSKMSSSTKLNSSGQVETPNALLGGAFTTSASTPASGILSDKLMAVRTGQAPVSSITQSSAPQSGLIQAPVQPQGITAQQATENINKFNIDNPTQPSTQDTHNKVGTGGAVTNPNDPNSYAGLLWEARRAQDEAAKYKADLTRNVINEQNNPEQSSVIGASRAGQESLQGTAEGQRLADVAKNAASLASAYAPTTQFGVLTNPVTGQPVGGGSAGSAAFQGGVIGGQQAAGANYAGMAVANNAAKGVKATLDDFVSNNPTVNSSPSTIANAISQWALGKQLGDPKVQTFLNDVQEYVSTLAPILGIGGTPTDAKTFIANSFVNPLASGQSIMQVLNGIETLANNKLAYYATAGQGGSTNPNIASQHNASSSGSLYDF